MFIYEIKLNICISNLEYSPFLFFFFCDSAVIVVFYLPRSQLSQPETVNPFSSTNGELYIPEAVNPFFACVLLFSFKTTVHINQSLSNNRNLLTSKSAQFKMSKFEVG